MAFYSPLQGGVRGVLSLHKCTLAVKAASLNSPAVELYSTPDIYLTLMQYKPPCFVIFFCAIQYIRAYAYISNISEYMQAPASLILIISVLAKHNFEIGIKGILEILAWLRFEAFLLHLSPR